jgi:Carboxymuconolactone decarboxylase family
MLGWLVRRKIAGFERDFDYDMNYARDIYAASPRAFFRFSKILGISSYREDVPKEAWYAAKLAATVTEDCGPCTQLVVKMAEREGVSPEAIRAVLRHDENAMPADASLGFRFAQAVLARDIAESDRLRREVLAKWGKKGLVSLALTIASARVYPSVKYALGHGHACTKVSLAGTEVAVNHSATPVIGN